MNETEKMIGDLEFNINGENNKIIIMRNIPYVSLDERYFDLSSILNNIWKVYGDDCKDKKNFILDAIYSIYFDKYNIFLDYVPDLYMDKNSTYIEIFNTKYMYFIEEQSISKYINDLMEKYKNRYFDRIYCHNYDLDQDSRFLISMNMNDSYKIEFFIDSYHKDTIKYYYKDDKDNDKVYTEYYNK